MIQPTIEPANHLIIKLIDSLKATSVKTNLTINKKFRKELIRVLSFRYLTVLYQLHC
jgi:hypothetical protein